MTPRLSLFSFLGLALLAGCRNPGPQFDASLVQLPSMAGSATNRVDPAWLLPDTNAFVLGPGDRLELEVIGDITTRATAFVCPDGKIYYYLLPGLEVAGLTLPQAKELIEMELGKLVRNGPKVAMTLQSVESRRVWLLGRLNSPGVYTMSAPMTLLEAIAVAGGPASPAAAASLGGGLAISVTAGTEEVADLSRSFVIRNGQALPVDFKRLLQQGDASQNIVLRADDFVYVPSAVGREVYVLGAVGQPRAIPYGRHLSLVAAVANAGGTIEEAYLSHMAIVRGSISSPQIAVVDYRDIVNGRAQDVLLEPNDIVYVPFTPYRILGRYLDLILDTFVRTVGANAGARAVDPDAAPISPNVTIDGTIPVTP